MVVLFLVPPVKQEAPISISPKTPLKSRLVKALQFSNALLPRTTLLDAGQEIEMLARLVAPLMAFSPILIVEFVPQLILTLVKEVLSLKALLFNVNVLELPAVKVAVVKPQLAKALDPTVKEELFAALSINCCKFVFP